ncbi:MAG: hypothetical protein GY808_07435 [Gammaproteobacteria bacterium]|nr:hypothetical protein [Gammaproteobacteria bacterium]
MDPRYVLLILVLFAGFQLQGASRLEVNEKSCKGIDIRIDKLNSQLRKGYTLKKGEVWKSKLRILKKNKFNCRMKRFSTQ